MQGIITSFRRGRHVQKDSQMIILVDDVSDKKKAEALVGKVVTFKTKTGKDIKGKVTAPHGTKGAVRAKFEKGMPGQSLGKKVSLA